MEFPPAGKLLFHLARRLERKREVEGEYQGGGVMCAELHCALASVPSKMGTIRLPVLRQSFPSLSNPPQAQSLRVRKTDEQGMENMNV